MVTECISKTIPTDCTDWYIHRVIDYVCYSSRMEEKEKKSKLLLSFCYIPKQYRLFGWQDFGSYGVFVEAHDSDNIVVCFEKGKTIREYHWEFPIKVKIKDKRKLKAHLKEQLMSWLAVHLLSPYAQAYVYPPGWDDSGLEDEDRELLGLPASKEGWRYKIWLPEIEYTLPRSVNVVEDVPSLDAPEFRPIPTYRTKELLFRGPLEFDEEGNIAPLIYAEIRAYLKSQKVLVYDSYLLST